LVEPAFSLGVEVILTQRYGQVLGRDVLSPGFLATADDDHGANRKTRSQMEQSVGKKTVPVRVLGKHGVELRQTCTEIGRTNADSGRSEWGQTPIVSLISRSEFILGSVATDESDPLHRRHAECGTEQQFSAILEYVASVRIGISLPV
jgi:hypothetical protein